jgi:hypothetical protein
VGEKQNQPFQLSFNASLKVDFQGSRVTSDGGLVLVRELDERLGLSELIEQHLTDSRGKNTQLPLAGLLRQSVYSRLAGYEDMNDTERLSQDPTLRLLGSEKIWERGAALTSRLQSFETEVLARDENLAGLEAINRGLIAQAEAIDSSQRVVLDMDSTEIPVYGQQEHSAYNGHFESTCYHPVPPRPLPPMGSASSPTSTTAPPIRRASLIPARTDTSSSTPRPPPVLPGLDGEFHRHQHWKQRQLGTRHVQHFQYRDAAQQLPQLYGLQQHRRAHGGCRRADAERGR